MVMDIRVLSPEELIAKKLISSSEREGQPKGDTDRRDLKVLLLAYPQLKTESGPVMQRIVANGGDEKAIEAWRRIVASVIRDDSDEY